MQTKKQRVAVMLFAAGLGLASVGVQAKEPLAGDTDRKDKEFYSHSAGGKHGKFVKASKLIGMEVKNHQNENLGKIDDLIINPGYDVKFAVISTGGAFGAGDKQIAVPINELDCSADGQLTLAATPDQLKNASATPTGGWLAVSDQEWARDIDGYYGQPEKFSMKRSGQYRGTSRTYERESFGSLSEREPVRAEQGNGAKQLITHDDHADLFDEPLIGGSRSDYDYPETMSTSDQALQQRLSTTLRDSYPDRTGDSVHVTVENGVVTLRGSAANETERRNIESTVQQTSGVKRVNNQLLVRSR